jgi:cell division protein FtsQ
MTDLGREARVYHRRRRRLSAVVAAGNGIFVRALTRAVACMMLVTVIGYGLWRGDHLDAPGNETESLLGAASSVVGHAAQTIRIAGLEHQSPDTVLAALGIAPGSSLIGFDPAIAKRLLENLDWVEEATVRVRFPNQLEIEVVERRPYAIWQRDGRYYVIDRTGAALGMDPGPFVGRLPFVAGEGAQSAVFDLVNRLDVHSALKSKVVAAARVGQRRWTLYFANNVKVALPEVGIDDALAWLDRVDAEEGLLGKGISTIDLRVPNRVVIVPQGTVEPAGAGGVKVSESREQ